LSWFTRQSNVAPVGKFGRRRIVNGPHPDFELVPEMRSGEDGIGGMADENVAVDAWEFHIGCQHWAGVQISAKQQSHCSPSLMRKKVRSFCVRESVHPKE
jgi:hypothetical protein